MKIYAYTFPKDKKEINKEKKYPIKIGCTKRDVDKRIDEQITASNREVPEKLYESTNVQFNDHKVHRILEKYGECRDSKEWFITNIDTIKRAVNEASGFASRPKAFKLRPDQQKAVNQAYDYFTTNGGGIYLWNAKMRFGKTFCAYQLMKKIEANKTLILTYKPAVGTEWEDELNNHVDFEKYNFVKAIEAKKNKIVLPNNSVLFASFQDILQDFKKDEENPDRKNNYSIKPKFRNILKESFDLVIIDEVHFGATNEAAQQFLKELDYITTLYLSGTPFKLINRGDLSEDQIFNWTYIDEQTCKNDLLSKGFNSVSDLINKEKFNPYLSLPKMEIWGYSIGKNALDDMKYYDDEKKFNFAKFFNSHNGQLFENQQAVKHFLDIISAKKSNTSPFFTKNIANLDHTLWLLPNVNSVHALYHTLKKHPFFKDYDIIPTAGNNLGKGSDSLALVKKAINGYKNNGYKGTITISCRKLTMGVTVKKWNAVFLLTNTNSMELYFQVIFRAQSPDVDQNGIDYKKCCYVFDFDSDRMIKTIYNYSKKCDKNKHVTKNLKTLLTTMNLLCYIDNKFVKLDVDAILRIADQGIPRTVLQKFGHRNLIDINTLDNLTSDKKNKLYEILKTMKLYRKVFGKNEKHKANRSKKRQIENKKPKKGKTSEETKKDKISEEGIQKLQRLLTRLPIFMYLSEYVEEKLEDVIENLEPELFETVTDVKIATFKELKCLGAFNINDIDGAITTFKFREHDSLVNDKKTDVDILNEMANISNEEIFTPVSIVNEVLNTLPDNVWANPSLRWLNPAVKNGVWLREVYRRLFKGLKNIIINKEQREYHIKKNMLYGYATSDVAWMMACKTMYGQYDGKYIRWKNSEYINNIKNKRFLETEVNDMPKMDLLIGNPPYHKQSNEQQDIDGGNSSHASSIYHKFVTGSIDLYDPRFLSMIIPSRWMIGGRGLKLFRERMLSDKHIKSIQHFPGEREKFKTVSIPGGVMYFSWSKEYNGQCKFNDKYRDLDKYDICLVDNKAESILDIILEKHKDGWMNKPWAIQKPFGLVSSFDKWCNETDKNAIKCYKRGKELKFVNNYYTDKFGIIHKWKVLLGKADGNAFTGTKWKGISNWFIVEPETICTQSYIVINAFDKKEECEFFVSYMKTKFFQFMLSIHMITQDINRDKFSFVPDQLYYTREYTDKYLYKKYGLTPEEVEFIESKFK